jgi:hypothetical protein
LPEHLERVVTKLSSARASGVLDDAFDPLVDEIARELDTARAAKGGVRGDAREAMIARLADLDRALIERARESIETGVRASLDRDADEELAGFRASMPPDAYRRARAGAVDRLLRERLGLPTIAFS